MQAIKIWKTNVVIRRKPSLQIASSILCPFWQRQLTHCNSQFTTIMARHHSHHHSKKVRPGDRATESSDQYGCWKGTPISYTGQTLEQDKSPHITLKFSDGTSNKTFEAQINVASTEKETEIVYWLNNNWSHPITKTLTPLSEGFHEATTTDGTGLSLDFIRTTPALVDFSAGLLVQDSDSSESNDILSEIEPIIKDAIAAQATVYIFGRSYGTGIDDIHMNQGNTGDFENAVGIDGALIFHYPTGDQQWIAVFLAFATQEVPTDDQTGAPAAGAKALDTIAMGGSS